MENSFYAMSFRMKYIRRWGLMYSVNPESLSEHSLEVGICAHALAVIGNTYFGKAYNVDRIAVQGMYHDVPEIFTGDIPTPVKYYNAYTRDSYKAVENAALDHLLEMLPKELLPTYEQIFTPSGEEKKLIKAADKICALVKCRDEAHFGNPEFREAEKTLQNSLRELHCEEAEYFLQQFGSSFSQPLDTLITEQN